MRVVVDTNTLCSSLITPGGLADRLYVAWRDRRLNLVTCEEQLEEFRRVTRYPPVRKYIDPAAACSMHNELRHLTTFLADLPVVEACRDPADNFLLAMAQVSEADFALASSQLGRCWPN